MKPTARPVDLLRARARMGRGQIQAARPDSADHGDLGEYAGMVADAPEGALVDPPAEMPDASGSLLRYGDPDAPDLRPG